MSSSCDILDKWVIKKLKYLLHFFASRDVLQLNYEEKPCLTCIHKKTDEFLLRFIVLQSEILHLSLVTRKVTAKTRNWRNGIIYICSRSMTWLFHSLFYIQLVFFIISSNLLLYLCKLNNI